MKALRIAIPALLLALSVSTCAAAPDWAVAVFPSGREFSLEIAADPRDRQRGYMFREHVGPNEGMLFVFETSQPHGFWMKNCKVALDLIWLDEQFRVVDMALQMQPCPEEGECPMIQPLRSARYVLEVAGGTVESEGLRRGQRLVVMSDPKLP